MPFLGAAKAQKEMTLAMPRHGGILNFLVVSVAVVCCGIVQCEEVTVLAQTGGFGKLT